MPVDTNDHPEDRWTRYSYDVTLPVTIPAPSRAQADILASAWTAWVVRVLSESPLGDTLPEPWGTATAPDWLYDGPVPSDTWEPETEPPRD